MGETLSVRAVGVGVGCRDSGTPAYPWQQPGLSWLQMLPKLPSTPERCSPRSQVSTGWSQLPGGKEPGPDVLAHRLVDFLRGGHGGRQGAPLALAETVTHRPCRVSDKGASPWMEAKRL